MTPRTTTMKQRAGIGLCGGMLLWASVASAGTCQPIEYAELKDMSTPALRRLFCDTYTRVLELLPDAIRAVKEENPFAIAEVRREGQECTNTGRKIKTVLQARGIEVDLKKDQCDFSKELEEGQR